MSSPREKRNLALLAGGVGLLLTWIAMPAQAGIIAYEPFAGTAEGELVGQVTGGTGLNGAWAGTTGVSTVAFDNAGLTYTDSNGGVLVQSGNSAGVSNHKINLNDVQRNFTATLPDSGTYYVSAVVRVSSVKYGNYFGVGLAGTGGAIVLGQQNNSWGIYSYDDNSGAVAGMSGNIGQMAFLVAKITKGSTPGQSAVTLWVNPILGNEIASGTGTTGTLTNNVAWTGISTPVWTGDASGGGNWLADVRVGTTFADVTPFAAIPEPASLALLGLGALAFLRRRRG